MRLALGTFAVFLGLCGVVPRAGAQTVDDVARRGACSTAGLEGISAQLAETQMCLRPGAFVEFAPHAGITLSSSRIHPFLQASARDAVWAAAARGPITINSAFRTLADQYVLYHSGGCGLAAAPGRSNHQTGLAIDVQNYSAVRAALEAQGCRWLGSSDPVHFDCPGSDARADAIRAFQRLWNLNHPDDTIAEDGIYGPQTESRLARTPAAGFATSGCAPSCEAHCEGSVIVGADCGRGDCGAFGGLCSTAGSSAPRCVSAFCVADASEVPRARDVCLPDGRLAHCDGTGALGEPMACDGATRCEAIGDAAMCVEDVPVMPEGDAGLVAGDAGVPSAGDAEPPLPPRGDAGSGGSRVIMLTGGCTAGGGSPGGLALLGLVLVAIGIRSRRR